VPDVAFAISVPPVLLEVELLYHWYVKPDPPFKLEAKAVAEPFSHIGKSGQIDHHFPV
jgi:hypothetical protein